MFQPYWLTAKPIAHRGYHDRSQGRIENTVGAIVAAVERGFAVELDLQLTVNDEVVVFHDYVLDRLCEATGRVDQLNLAALRATRLRDSNEQIPTLDEVLEEVGGRVPLFLELKSHWTGDRRMEVAVVKAVTNYSGPVALMSFDPRIVSTLRKLIPHLPRGLLAGPHSPADDHPTPAYLQFAYRHLFAACLSLPNFIGYDVKALPASSPLMIRHVFRIPLLTWTVRNTAERQIADRWADQMIFEGFDPVAQNRA